jgi:hypothetical protein
MSDSLSSAHTTAADEAARQAAADTQHHPTADYPYAEYGTGGGSEPQAPAAYEAPYHPEADVYGGTAAAAPEQLTPDDPATADAGQPAPVRTQGPTHGPGV